MASLDIAYMADILHQAQGGSGSAFAELFAATYERQYVIACYYLGPSLQAQDALQEAYINALQNITRVHDATLLLPWMTQLTSRACLKMLQKNGGQIPTLFLNAHLYSMQQILSLPFTESQTLLLHYFCHMSIREAAQMLEMRSGAVRRSMRQGNKRLRQLAAGGTEE